MKNQLIVLISLLSVVSYGQSKKELNATYRDEVSQLKNAYDSCKTVYLGAEKQLDQSRKNVRAELRLLDEQKRLIAGRVRQIITKAAQLTALGIDVEPFVTEEDMKTDMVPKTDTYQSNKTLFNELYTYQVVYDTLQLEKVKMKQQNLLLLKQIEIYKTALAYNKKTIDREWASIQQLDSIKKSFEPIKIQMETANLYYQKKMNLLDEKLDEQRENYRLKGPKGFSPAYERVFPDVFVEDLPKISDDRVYNVGNIESDGSWDAVVPPPPPMENTIVDIVEEPAEFDGGMPALKKYLSDNLVYPQTAEELGIEGKVYLKFVVEKDGNISDIRVVKGISDCKECNYEAIRLVKAMPKWKPGKNGGKPVKQWYTMPIPFQLD